MPQNLESMGNVLKTQFLGTLRNYINFQARTVNALKPGTKEWEGDEIKFPFHSERSNNVAFIKGGESLPAALAQQFARVTIPLRQMWGHVRVTYDAKKASRTKKGSFVKAIAVELKTMAKEIVDMSERSVWGDGTGKIGEVKSSTGTTTVTVTTMRLTDSQGTGINGNADNRYIRKGMRLDFYTSGGVARMVGAKVASVNLSNGTFTVTGGTGSNPALTDGIYIARPDGTSPIGMEAMGIPGIIDDGTNVANLHGVDRSLYPLFTSAVIHAGTFGSPGAISEDQLQRAMDAVDEACGGEVEILMAHHSTRRAFLSLLVTNRRYLKAHEYAAGFREKKGEGKPKTSLTYNEVPFMVSKHVPWRAIYGWTPGVTRIYQYAEPEWVEDEQGNTMTMVPGIAGTLQAQMAWMYNVSVDDEGPNQAFVIDNINVSTIDRVVQT